MLLWKIYFHSLHHFTACCVDVGVTLVLLSVPVMQNPSSESDSQLVNTFLAFYVTRSFIILFTKILAFHAIPNLFLMLASHVHQDLPGVFFALRYTTVTSYEFFTAPSVCYISCLLHSASIFSLCNGK